MTKQEAIETIKLALSQVEWDYPLDYAAAFDMAISAMEKQDAPDTNVDTLSRQAAINAGLRLCERDTKAELINLCDASIADSEGRAGGILDYIGELEDLSPAQSEIIRCRDCQHYYYADNRIPREQRYVCDLDGDRWMPDDYCSYAERREE